MATKAGRYDEALTRTTGKSGALFALNGDTVEVEVFESDGTTNATLYDDRDKTAYSGTGSIVTPDSAGNIEFFADPGTYVLSVKSSGKVLRTDTVIVPVDPAEASSDVDGLASHVADTGNPHSVVLSQVDASSLGGSSGDLVGLDGSGGYSLVGSGTYATSDEVDALALGGTYQGEWDSGTAYAGGDIVEHEGSTYAAGEATTAGEEPGVSAKWQVVIDGAAYAKIDGSTGFFDVTHPNFGAKGDASTDDTAAIQLAIDAAAALSVGGENYSGIVYLPPGVYMSGQLTIPSRVIIIGSERKMGHGYREGPTRILPTGLADDSFLFVQDGVNIRQSGIIGISSYGDGSASKTGFLNFTDADDCIFHSVYADNWGIEAVKLAGGNCRVNHCSFRGLSNGAYIAADTGAFVLSGADHQVSNCEFTSYWTNTGVSSANLYCASADVSGTSSLFEGCVFQLGDSGLRLSGGARHRFVGCRFDTNGGHGLYLGSGTDHIFSGCAWSRNSYAATNTYDHIRVPSTGGGRVTFVAPAFTNQSWGGEVQYCINDEKNSTTFHNTYLFPFGQSGTTGFANVTSTTVVFRDIESVVSLGGGTVELGRLTFDGDDDTFIESPGADQVSVTTAGTTQWTVDSNGLLKNSGSNYVSLIGAFGASSLLRGAVSGDADSRLRVLGDGRIQWGSGSASPVTMLQRASDTKLRATVGLEVDGDLDHDGTNVGFYGAAPVAKAADPGTATGTDATVINNIVTALRNLGLVT